MVKRSRLRAKGVGRRRLVVSVLLAAVMIGGVAWYLHKAHPRIWDRLSSLITGDSSDVQSRESVRGMIYDRNYRALAVSYERVSIYVNTREISDLNEVFRSLADILGTSREELSSRVGVGNIRVWLARDISQEQEDAIHQLQLPGVYLHKEFVRYYPQQAAAAHLIGFVEGDTGLAGIEHFLSRLETRYRLGVRDATGLEKLADGRMGVDGRHLILTLDLKVQRLLDDFLEGRGSAASGSKRGIIVMEAATGALVGYAQSPSFDANAFHTYPESILDDIFDETIAVPDPFKRFLREVSLVASQPEDSVGPLPWSIMAEQRKLGVQLQLWDRLGASRREPYDFLSVPSRISDRVAFDPEHHLSQYYETVPVMQTPLQILEAVARTVNGGVAIHPHAADRFVLRRNQGEYLLESFGRPGEVPVLRDSMSNEIRDIFRQMGQEGPLKSAVLSGSSVSYRMDGGMTGFKRHNLEIAVVPADRPELLVMSVGTDPGYLAESKVDKPQSIQTLLAPVTAVQRVMKNLADMMAPRDIGGENYSVKPGSADQHDSDDLGRSAGEKHPDMVMPQLTGLSLRKSLRILQHAEVAISTTGTGRVIRQQPAAGLLLKPGTAVELVLARDQVSAEFRSE